MSTTLKIFRNTSQASKGKHIPGKTGFRCHDCKLDKPTPEGCGTGYSIYDEKHLVCYSCADAREREAIKERKPYFAYLSGDGLRVTTWTGGKLMDVVRSRPCTLTRPSWTHDRKSYKSVSAVDVHGGKWHGRGSAGICIKMRPSKN